MTVAASLLVVLPIVTIRSALFIQLSLAHLKGGIPRSVPPSSSAQVATRRDWRHRQQPPPAMEAKPIDHKRDGEREIAVALHMCTDCLLVEKIGMCECLFVSHCAILDLITSAKVLI